MVLANQIPVILKANKEINHVNKQSLPKFLDVHSCSNITEESLKELQVAPPDEFGVKQLNVLYNKVYDLCFCFLEAPNREAVEKHHEKYNLKCQWITEVQTIA
jgi:hypothetical protein